ncbi:MAG: ATP phosphoribosyltransferase [Rhodospirillales bacterium]|nr:ATP phosphoribosyltransferase [Rhodospirillales bacterium]
MLANEKLILALPRGRILDEVLPLIGRAGLEPEDAFHRDDARQIRFSTSDPSVDIIRVRSFDVATIVAFGAAHMGVAGADVLLEFESREIYAPLDLDLGHCRMVVAAPEDLVKRDNPKRWSHIRIATKYPEITKRHFAARGVQAECVKLSGAVEIAPALGLCERIVDLVSTGATLKANGLVEVEEIARISSRLAVNRTALKTRSDEVSKWISRFREAVDARPA